MRSHAPSDLNNIRFLLEVVRAGSISAAARELQFPPSAVSRRLAKLEEDLGVKLLQRTTRSLQVTEVGRTYLTHAQRALEELELGQRAIGEWQSSPRGRVRMSAPAGFGEVLWSLLPTFLAANPEVRLELHLAERYVELVEERIDLALRSTYDTNSPWVGYRFGSSPRQLFASPSYLERRGPPRTVNDLVRHDCVILGANSERATWTLQVGKKTRKVAVRGRVAVNEARLAARAAADGFGIALLSRALCRSFLSSGELRPVLPRVNGGDSALWLVYPDRRLRAPVRALADFLRRELPLALPAKATFHVEAL